MIFKNMVAYRLFNGWNVPLNKLEASLERLKDARCGATQKLCVGWEPFHEGEMVHSVQGHRLMNMRIEEKILPSGVVKKEVKRRCKLLEQNQGRKPGRKEIRELQDEIELELLPKAFIKESNVYVWIDREGKWIGMDVGSSTKAEEVIKCLLEIVADFPGVSPISTQNSPSYVMREWLTNQEATHGFAIDDECELVGNGDVKSSINYKKHTLDGEDVQQHLTEGKLPSKLGVTFDECVAFIFNEKFEIKKIQMIGFEDEKGEDNQEDNFNASFLAEAETMSKALTALILACGGEAGGDEGGYEGGDEPDA
jgi:recombination associated protein RdgC